MDKAKAGPRHVSTRTALVAENIRAVIAAVFLVAGRAVNNQLILVVINADDARREVIPQGL